MDMANRVIFKKCITKLTILTSFKYLVQGDKYMYIVV